MTRTDLRDELLDIAQSSNSVIMSEETHNIARAIALLALVILEGDNRG